mgnify:CR=1 FL=1
MSQAGRTGKFPKILPFSQGNDREERLMQV